METQNSIYKELTNRRVKNKINCHKECGELLWRIMRLFAFKSRKLLVALSNP